MLSKAMSQYGIKEIAGKEDNPEVLKYFEAVGFGSLKDETAWCSAFMNWVAIKAGADHSGELTARSWLKVGRPVKVPKIGDITVLWRVSPDSWKGHVGLYIREHRGWIYLLGGNQSNQVKISAYPRHRLLGYRRV